MKIYPFYGLVLLLTWTTGHAAYESSYNKIQWDKRGNDTFYCIDITDDKFQIHPWLQALLCEENLYSFSPKEYLSQMKRSFNLAPNTRFGWRVWSASGYGGSDYEGIITVPSVDIIAVSNCKGESYLSSNTLLQWGCRGNDTFYCIDILDVRGNFVKQAAQCGEGLHRFFPDSLNLASGDYRWKIWSNSGYGGWAAFEGQFTIRNQNPPLPPEPSPVVPSPVAPVPNAKFTCSGKTRCSQMTSCEEATFYLRNCPNVEIDGNNDGVPCEEQWCGH